MVGETDPGNKRIASQFKLRHLFIAIACLAFVIGARSFWLTFKNPNIPFIASVLFGTMIAVLAERTRLHLVVVLVLACTAAILPFSLYSWESMQNSKRPDFPHVITYHYSGDLDLHVIAGVMVLIGTLISGGCPAAAIRYSRTCY